MAVQNVSSLKNKFSEVTVVPAPAKDLYIWLAPERPFKKRSKEYFTTVAAIALLLAVILLFIKEWLLIAVIIAFMFVSYALATVPPQTTTNKITTRGVYIDEKIYKWSQLNRFWFSQKWNSNIIHFETNLSFPHHLQLIMEKNKQEFLKKIVEKYILFDEPRKNFIDRSSAWLQKRVPLESS